MSDNNPLMGAAFYSFMLRTTIQLSFGYAGNVAIGLIDKTLNDLGYNGTSDTRLVLENLRDDMLEDLHKSEDETIKKIDAKVTAADIVTSMGPVDPRLVEQFWKYFRAQGGEGK